MLSLDLWDRLILNFEFREWWIRPKIRCCIGVTRPILNFGSISDLKKNHPYKEYNTEKKKKKIATWMLFFTLCKHQNRDLSWKIATMIIGITYIYSVIRLVKMRVKCNLQYFVQKKRTNKQTNKHTHRKQRPTLRNYTKGQLRQPSTEFD